MVNQLNSAIMILLFVLITATVTAEARIHEQLSLYRWPSDSSELDLVCMVADKKQITLANNSNLQEWILPLEFNYAAPFYSTWGQYLQLHPSDTEDYTFYPLQSSRPNAPQTVSIDFTGFFHTFGQDETNRKRKIKTIFCIGGTVFYNNMFGNSSDGNSIIDIVINADTQMSVKNLLQQVSSDEFKESGGDPCCSISTSLFLAGFLAAVGCSGSPCFFL